MHCPLRPSGHQIPAKTLTYTAYSNSDCTYFACSSLTGTRESECNHVPFGGAEKHAAGAGGEYHHRVLIARTKRGCNQRVDTTLLLTASIKYLCNLPPSTSSPSPGVAHNLCVKLELRAGTALLASILYPTCESDVGAVCSSQYSEHDSKVQVNAQRRDRCR